MPRRFNTAGPCNPSDHYMLPVLARLPEVREIIDSKLYFVLHAPRQAGKTTSLLALAEALTREGSYVAVLLSMKVGSIFSDDIGAAELAILSSWRDDTAAWLPAELQPPPWPEAPAGRRIGAALSEWARRAPRPLVVFLDEFDALRGEALLSVLSQLHSGYPRRPKAFPWSVAFVGLRDVRDYKVAASDDGVLGTSSPFNIKSESVTLLDFTRDEVAALYAQHSADTGQAFLPEAVDRAFYWTQGQPWLVNALARQIVQVLVKDRATPITAGAVDQAKETLIVRQDTHLDSLADRLSEPRIRAILEPMLAGTALGAVVEDDIRFAKDLGLLRQSAEGGLEVSNPIYREVIVRELAATPRASLPQIAPSWLTAGGRLDRGKLLDAFLAFWRQHGEPLLGSAPYAEIAPHLVLMAFLHRVVNGGGTIEREYAIGRGRMDLCVRYGGEVIAIELKVWRDREKDPVGAGLAQLDGYLAGLGLETGWLVIFDRRSGAAAISERTGATGYVTPGERSVVVVRG